MRKIIRTQIHLLIVLVAGSTLSCFAQTQTDLAALNRFLTGTKYACIELTSEEQRLADSGQNPIVAEFADYLKGLNFQRVAYTTEDKTQLMLQVPTLCDVAKVRLTYVFENNSYIKHRIRFRSCLGGENFVFNQKSIAADYNLYSKLRNLWREMYDITIEYNSSNRLKWEPKESMITEATVLSKLGSPNREIDFIEGIYEKKPSFNYTNHRHKIAILKGGTSHYKIYYLDGISNYLDWTKGEYMGMLPKSNTNFRYPNVEWSASNKVVNLRGQIDFLDEYTFTLHFEGHPHIYEYKRITPANQPKLAIDKNRNSLPSSYEELSIKNIQSPVTAKVNNFNRSCYLSSTGSAIAISQDGYIITNYHVVANHDYIELMIPNNPFNVAYRAVIICSDEASDLALLRIEDIHFQGLSTIPYHFRYREADVGEEVFTLGFPLVESMGRDIKLGDGLISSSKGYRDDPKTYQISVPVNPGNSGGPLFSKKGELVGIIKAKHSKANNASYALKTSNILTLINKAGLNLRLPENNYLRNESMMEQVKQLEPFVFWVKAFKVR